MYVAGGAVFTLDGGQLCLSLFTFVFAIGAARMEVAPIRGIDGAGDIAVQYLAVGMSAWGGYGNRAEECFGIGVGGVFEDFVARSDFHDAPEVHHGDVIGDVPDYGEVVSDKEVGEAEFLLEIFEEVQNLRLDGDIERGDGFVGDDDLGVDGECTRDADTLSLATAEFVGVAIGGFGWESD